MKPPLLPLPLLMLGLRLGVTCNEVNPIMNKAPMPKRVGAQPLIILADIHVNNQTNIETGSDLAKRAMTSFNQAIARGYVYSVTGQGTYVFSDFTSNQRVDHYVIDASDYAECVSPTSSNCYYYTTQVAGKTCTHAKRA